MFNPCNAGTQHEIQLTLEENEAFIKKGEALDRLLDNADFQAVVMDGYIKGESHRLALATGNPALEDKEAQKRLFLQVQSIGNFNAYLRKIDREHQSAIKTKREHLEELERLTLEEQETQREG